MCVSCWERLPNGSGSDTDRGGLAMDQRSSEEWSIVDTSGRTVRERRNRLGMSQAELGDEAGVNRDTIGALEKGEGVRFSTVRAVSDALDRLEAETASPPDPEDERDDAHVMEFEVSGDFGVRVVVRGPVNDAEALEASVTRLVRNIRESGTDPEVPSP